MSADVATSLKNWSATESSNAPSGSTAISTNLDDNLRAIQAVVRQDLATKGSDISASATADIGAVAGYYHDITGSTTVTGLGTVSAGIPKILQFDSTPQLNNSTAIGLPTSANITTEAGDHLLAFSLGSGNWIIPFYQRKTGEPLGPYKDANPVVAGSADPSKKWRVEVDGFTSSNTRVFTPPDANLSISAVAAKGDVWGGTAAGAMGTLTAGTDDQVLAADASQATGLIWREKLGKGGLTATTSGSAIAVTGIPAWVKRVTIIFDAVSTNGTALPGVQIGDAGGAENSGYVGSSGVFANSGSTTSAALAGTSFAIQSAAAGSALYGKVELFLIDAATFRWGCAISLSDAAGRMFQTNGSKSLSAALDRFSLVTTDAFDAGQITYFYE